MERVVLGMSGGVDSAMAAVYLMRSGYDVLGVTCTFVPGRKAEADAADAAAVAETLGIRHRVVDVSDEFDRCVVNTFVHDYADGLTPSPCVGCNAYCKIPALMRVADDEGCTKIATGHYARIVRLPDSGYFAVKTALDPTKDQSYMLARLTRGQMARLILPLGGTTKTAVRIDAADIGLPVADKAESQDICFLSGDYRAFLRSHDVVSPPGDIVDMQGRVVGRHSGLCDYTIGQRKGIGIAAPEPYYVVAKIVERNVLVVGFEGDARIGSVVVGSMNWQAIDRPAMPLSCSVKLRYRSSPAPCIITVQEDGTVHVRLFVPQAMTAPGQVAVFYLGDTVLGGGTIESLVLVEPDAIEERERT